MMKVNGHFIRLIYRRLREQILAENGQFKRLIVLNRDTKSVLLY